jgi:hypothetical protein
MPRKKTTTVTELLPDVPALESLPENPSPDMIDETLELSERLSQIRESLGAAKDGLEIKVYRIQQGKPPAFCFRDKSVDEEKIQQRCKAGDFLCNVFANGKLLESIEVSIDEAATGASPSGLMQGMTVEQLQIQMLQQQNAQLMNMFSQFLNNQQQNNGAGLTGLVDIITSLKKLSAGPDEAVALKMFEKGVDLASKVSGVEKSWTTELFETVKDVVKPLAPALMQHLSNGQPTQTQQADSMIYPQLTENRIRQGIAILKQKALQNVPVSLVLDWIISNATDYTEIIRAVVTMDFADIAKLDPDIGTEPLAAWFKTLYDGLRAAYLESATVENDTAGANGDVDDVEHHEEPRVTVVPRIDAVGTAAPSRKRR